MRWFDHLELGWAFGTDFFPPKPDPTWLARTEEICIGTKSRNLGDALVLTSLPGAIKRAYPNIRRVTTYPRGFNPVAFRGNEHVDGLDRAPKALYGDDACWGSGHVIETKLRYFGINPGACEAADRVPKIVLSAGERDWASHDLREHHSYLAFDLSKPLCLIHPWGSSRQKVMRVEAWDALARELSKKYRVWQVGILNDSAVQGCDYYFLQNRSWDGIRKLCAVMEQAALFVGVDSGPMHVARAFSVPSVIMVSHVDPARVFAGRDQGLPFFDPIQRAGGFLYRENRYVFVDSSIYTGRASDFPKIVSATLAEVHSAKSE